MNKLYKDKNWLYQKYWTEMLSTTQIGKICNKTHKTILYWLDKRNIKTRTMRDGNKLIMSGKSNHMYRPKEERLWEKINKKNNISECWKWNGCKDTGGHGNIAIDGISMQSHRILYEVFYKDKIKKEEVVHHMCGDPLCCNPFHLIKITDFDHRSLHAKKRKRKYGEQSPNSKLTKKEVKNIRKLYKTGKYSYKKLSKKYNVSSTTIWQIISKQTWKGL